MFGEFRFAQPESPTNISVENTKEVSSPAIESELLNDVSSERRLEIERYGRAEVYEEIANYLEGDVRIAFALVNHAPAIVDDNIDVNGNASRLLDARVLLRESFAGRNIKSLELWGQRVVELGRVLSRLDQNGFSNARRVLNEVINYWIIEESNLGRQGRVLNAEELNELNLSIGRSIGLQFLYLLTPELEEEVREHIASSYGLAIKSADNLSDLHEDFEQGYINISMEDVEACGLDVENLNDSDLQQYILSEFKKVKQYYNESDEYLDEIIKQHPKYQQALTMFKKIAHSWLQQASEICSEL